MARMVVCSLMPWETKAQGADARSHPSVELGAEVSTHPARQSRDRGGRLTGPIRDRKMNQQRAAASGVRLAP